MAEIWLTEREVEKRRQKLDYLKGERRLEIAEMLKIARERTGNIYVQPHQGFNSDVAASTKAHEALNHVIEWVKNGGKCFDEQLPYYGKTLDE